MRAEQHRVFGLDAMRAAAIALVVINHTAIWFVACRPVFFAGCLAGYFGVEVFFVLSGFLIGGILFRSLASEEANATVLEFWKRRWFRTLPNYFLFLGLNVGLFVWLHGVMPPAGRYLFFLQNVTTSPPQFFTESWSLAIEEWFYLLVPVLMFAVAKRAGRDFRKSSLATVVMVIAAVAVARTIYVAIEEPDWINGVRMIVVYRFDACMFGVLAAWIKWFYPSWWRKPNPAFSFAALALFASIAWLALTAPADSLVLQTMGFPLTSLAAMLLLPRLDAWRPSRPTCIHKSVVAISLWSYSLYLVNIPVFTVLQTWHSASPAWPSVCFVCASIAAAAITYRFYERPMTSLRDRIWLSSREGLIIRGSSYSRPGTVSEGPPAVLAGSHLAPPVRVDP